MVHHSAPSRCRTAARRLTLLAACAVVCLVGGCQQLSLTPGQGHTASSAAYRDPAMLTRNRQSQSQGQGQDQQDLNSPRPTTRSAQQIGQHIGEQFGRLSHRLGDRLDNTLQSLHGRDEPYSYDRSYDRSYETSGFEW